MLIGKNILMAIVQAEGDGISDHLSIYLGYLSSANKNPLPNPQSNRQGCGPSSDCASSQSQSSDSSSQQTFCGEGIPTGQCTSNTLILEEGKICPQLL